MDYIQIIEERDDEINAMKKQIEALSGGGARQHEPIKKQQVEEGEHQDFFGGFFGSLQKHVFGADSDTHSKPTVTRPVAKKQSE